MKGYYGLRTNQIILSLWVYVFCLLRPLMNVHFRAKLKQVEKF